MRLKYFMLLLLSAVIMSSCDEIQNILQGDSDKEDTEIQGPGDNSGEDPGDAFGQDDPADDLVGEVTSIGEVIGNGTYSLKGTVVTAGPDAYILADETGAILVYGNNHGRTAMEVVKVKGTVSRYRGYDTNVLQVATESVIVLDEESVYKSSPVFLDATSFDALVGKKASCTEVSFTGPLVIDTNSYGTFVNIQIAGAQKKASLKYYNSIDDYKEFEGKDVDFRGYVVGTNNYLYVMPVSVTLGGQQTEDPTPEPTPGCDKINAITTDGTYTVQGTVVAVGSAAYIIADDTDALMIYGYNHGRSLGDVVKITGNAYRFGGYSTNVFQMKDVVPEVIQTGASYSYNPTSLTAEGLDSWVGATAYCYEVEFTGELERSDDYINIAVDGASYKGLLTYVDNSEYDSIETGSCVGVKGFIVSTYNYLKVLPYSVTVVSAPETGLPSASEDSDPTTKKWMELPAMTDSNLDYYCHSFDLNGKTYRNYSFGWDDSNKVAYWVAYPLCSMYIEGDAGRQEDYFIKDPLLGDASPRPGGGYAGSYDRGHQIPSADRQCSELANGQTYYGTNMTAQSNPLNGGPWANLEGAVRSFAKSSSDTTYVVTGCYVEDSVEWSTDSDGMRIKVPTAYFKAILVLKNGSWTGGAYWTPHVGYSSSYTSWAISIDELEQKTGLDLYVNLPDKIGANAAAEIEAAGPGDSKWWN